MNLQFDAEGRADVAALNDGPTNQDIAGKVSESQGIVESVAAMIADEGMIGGTEAVLILEFLKVGNVFEFTTAVGSLARKGPVAGRSSRGTSRETDDGGGNVFAGQAVANKEIFGRPWLGKISDLGDGGIGFRGMRQ